MPSRARSPSTRCSRASCACASGWRRAPGDERILLVTHYGWLHFFLGHALFGDAFGPEHLIPLWYAAHANTGITVFERRNRRMDGMDF